MGIFPKEVNRVDKVFFWRSPEFAFAQWGNLMDTFFSFPYPLYTNPGSGIPGGCDRSRRKNFLLTCKCEICYQIIKSLTKVKGELGIENSPYLRLSIFSSFFRIHCA